jgi:hypothetical protein
MSYRHKTKHEFRISTTLHFVSFSFTNMVLLKVVHPLNIHHSTTFHGPTLTVASFSHIRSLNIRHFGMLEATGLKSVASRSPSMA